MRCRPVAITVLLGVGIFGGLVTTEAQRRPVPRLGILGLADAAGAAHRMPFFLDGLRALGYVDGQTIAIEYRWAEGRFDRLPALAAELVRLPVDILVTMGGGFAVRAAQKATTTIPIVAVIMNDPVEAGFVASLARPGGNITGQAFQGTELTVKQIELLREAVPQLSRVAVLWHAAGNREADTVRAAQDTAKALRVQLHIQEVREPSDLDRAVAAAKASGTQALLQIPSPFFPQHRAALAALLTKHRLPAMCEGRLLVDAGCLMAYGANFDAMFGRTAYYVDRILKGAKPAELPVERPREFELVVNGRTAHALGLTLPPSLLLQATEVLQ